MVLIGLLISQYVSSSLQIADTFTKPLCKASLRHLCNKIYLQPLHNLREGIEHNQRNNQLEYTTCSDKEDDKAVDQDMVVIPKNKRNVKSN